jgi:alginate O-acetyltransferase complex protein AlgI
MVVVLLGFFDFYLSQRIAEPKNSSRRLWLIFGLLTHLSVLLYFKYSNFLVDQLSLVLLKFSVEPPHWTKVLLPIGVSFITFEEMSYLIDVYRGDARPARSWNEYLLFLTLFPHAIAGPIFRWKDLESQLRERTQTLSEFCLGLLRFVAGLSKKVLIANTLALTADYAFDASPRQLTPFLAWSGAFAYAFEIYFDFSGYSDMAIGLGQMMGFRFKENFNDPYISKSLTEYWRRWHMSLSQWMRDYLYIPLGGSWGKTWQTYRNLIITFICCGAWHGANWTFFVFGLYHGFFLVMERIAKSSSRSLQIPTFLRVAMTFLLVTFGLTIFRSTDLSTWWRFTEVLVGFDHANSPLPVAQYLPARTLFVALIAAWLSFSPSLPKRLFQRNQLNWNSGMVAAGLALLCLANLCASKFSPFIYFKF